MSDFLSHRTRQCLERAGWQPRRQTDTSAIQNELCQKNGFISDIAIAFLKEFGGLSIRYPHFRDPTYQDGCHFNALRALNNVDPLQIVEYEKVLGRRVTVIGEAFSDHMTLMMDEFGTVYAGFEDCLITVGNSGVDAVNNLCDGRECEPIDYARNDLWRVNASGGLSSVAVTNLAAAGWFPQRRVDLPVRTGVTINNAAKEFLQEFQGVRLACAPAGSDEAATHDESSTGNSSIEIWEFTASAVEYLPDGHFDEYRRKTGQMLTAIGFLENEHSVLLMGDDGRVFVGIPELPDILWLVGESGHDAINNLCAGADRHRVL